MGIEDLITKASHSDHQKKADLMQKSLEDVRIPLLLKHYKNSMSAADKANFESLSEMDQVNKLVENKYKLPHEHAEAFLRDVAFHATKHVSDHLAEGMGKFMKIIDDGETDPEKKAEALQEVEHYMTIMQSYGINLPKIKEEGKEHGFSKQLFDNNVGYFGRTYLDKKRRSFLDQISENEVDNYLPKIKGEEGMDDFEDDKAKDTLQYEEKRELIGSYLAGKRDKDTGGLNQFREMYKKYFKGEKKD